MKGFLGFSQRDSYGNTEGVLLLKHSLSIKHEL